ncbi:MAG: hypothetical protein QF907_07865 [Nitrospinota bacterium]|nr:hypothetical protein [Nitrospinota bacterium]MDP7580212.1 hypothetical protein [Nitrospinota bacterium]HJN01841.1 hypothetical protein [Nitrospinota bacterium]
MFAQKDILLFIHILTLATAFGGSIFQIFVLPAILRKRSGQKNTTQITVSTISTFSPISFGLLSIIVFTGMLLLFSLIKKTSNIASPLYLNIFFIKILLVTVIFSIAAFQTFCLRFKIVNMDIDKIKGENPPKPFRVMRTCSIINIILITIVIFLGISMSNMT